MSAHSVPSPLPTWPFSKMASIIAMPIVPLPKPIFCAAAFRLCSWSLDVAEAAEGEVREPELPAAVESDQLVVIEDSIAETGRAKVADVDVVVEVDNVGGGAATAAGVTGEVLAVPVRLDVAVGATVLVTDELLPPEAWCECLWRGLYGRCRASILPLFT